MSEPTSPHTEPDQPEVPGPAGETYGVAEPPAEAPTERVALGLAAAVVALVLGAALTLLVWSLGFIASITSFVMAAGAVFLYRLAAGAPPRRGVVPLVVLVVAGVAATFFVLIGYDAAQAYDELAAGLPSDEVVGKWEFVRSVTFDGEVLKSYGKDMAFFFGFALLGIWTTLKNVLGNAGD